MKKLIVPLSFLALTLNLNAQENRLMRKAANAVNDLEYEQALNYYEEALKNDKDSYRANAGKGVVLAEYLGSYEEAIPYLDKALQSNPKKTSNKLTYDLGKSYHYIGNYTRALYYYDKLVLEDDGDNPDLDGYLLKRIEDCKYALEHKEMASADVQSINNVGKPINTSMPEYGPVLANNMFLFTTKRQDDPREKRNGIDGKYFESIEVCSYDNGAFSEPRRYTLPDKKENSNWQKHNESVVSATRDGKKVFIFRDGQLYEGDLENTNKDAVKLSNTINFSHFQSHSYLAPDGKTLYFSSESDKGVGGMDIYRSENLGNGKWSEPELLGNNVNTIYDEDAPFMSENGTLFFSSNGHPGYGGFDIYKTKYADNAWTEPKNLGQPINSPGDESYFNLKPNSSEGYYSSSRKGGYGDMDIYTVHYSMDDTGPCSSTYLPALAINSIQDTGSSLGYNISASLPEGYEGKIKSYTWQLNDSVLPQTSQRFNYAFNAPGTYTISMQALVYCDTCSSTQKVCIQKVIEADSALYVNPILDPLTASSSKTGNEGEVKDHTAVKDNALAYEKTSDAARKYYIPNNVKPKENVADNRVKKNINSATNSIAMSGEQLANLDWNNSVEYFDYNDCGLNDNTRLILDHNIGILKKNKDLTFTISGHTDSRGSAAYNKELSRKRANAVKDYLVKNGISMNRLKGVYAMGETMIVNGCEDGTVCSEEMHQENRRVEVKVFSPSSNVLTSLSAK